MSDDQKVYQLNDFDEPTLSANELLEFFDGDHEILDMVITKFTSEYQNYTNSIEEAIQNKNLSELEHGAHTLKGVCANLFLSRLKKLSFALESYGKNQVWNNSEELLKETKLEIERAKKALTELQSTFSREAS
jgi:HPt (histidine-containing phosphotransfer) domain-containing protein